MSLASTPPASGRVVLVTGASRGIGAACARLLGAQGWHVWVNYRDKAAAAAAVVSAIQAAGGQAQAVQADVASEDQVLRMFDTIEHTSGRLDGLVNSAGILGTPCSAADFDDARVLEVFQTNVFGSIRCIRAAMRRMSTQSGGQGGSIVNLSSTAARNGGPAEHALYAASKGALDSLTLSLARELGAHGIRINGVRPGIVATDIHAPRGGLATLTPLAAQIPLGRLGQPDDIAQAVAWLLSEQAAFVHGACLDVAGGR